MPRRCLHLVIDLSMHTSLLILVLLIRTSTRRIINCGAGADSARGFASLFITVCHSLLLQLLPAHVVIIVFGVLLDGRPAGRRMFLQVLLELIRVFYLLEAVHISVPM